MYGEIAIILALIMANGLFAMAEIAMVSARPTRLRQMAEAGSAGAGAALCLSENPGPFLATIQIGITLVGVVSGAYGEAKLAQYLKAPLASMPVVGAHYEIAADIIVVLAITYLTLVFGELTPKALALTHAETIAARLALPMQVLGRVTAPAVWVLNQSAGAVSRILGGRRVAEAVSREEIKMTLTQWSDEGVLDTTEADLAAGLLELAERPVESIMTHRSEVVWLDADADVTDLRATITAHRYVTFPVAEGSLRRPLGAVRAPDLLAALLAGDTPDLRALVRPMPSVPEHVTILGLLQVIAESPTHMALVIGDYGEVVGIVTLTDAMQVVLGPIGALSPEFARRVVPCGADAWSVDATMPIEEFEKRWKVEVPEEERGGYLTVAGLLLHLLGRLPEEDEEVTWGRLHLTVQEVQDRRIARVLVRRVNGPHS